MPGPRPDWQGQDRHLYRLLTQYMVVSSSAL